MIITSKNNPIISFACKLKDKKQRDKENMFLLETEKVVREAIKNGLIPYKIFVINEEDFQDFDCQVVVSKEVMKKMTSLVSPNVVAIFKKKEQKQVDSKRFLILDNIQDPHNLGAILRSAVATNFLCIYKISGVDLYNEKVIRSAMGNIFKVSILEISYEDVSKITENADVFVADMDGENIFKKSFDLKNRIGIVIGNEGSGISSEISKFNFNKISIPMHNAVESLNASVSASVCMYEITKGE